jgi:hypothetical protein
VNLKILFYYFAILLPPYFNDILTPWIHCIKSSGKGVLAPFGDCHLAISHTFFYEHRIQRRPFRIDPGGQTSRSAGYDNQIITVFRHDVSSLVIEYSFSWSPREIIIFYGAAEVKML